MSPRLANIGTVGHQMDVADGGDVDPRTGRLLTIAEMQAALRMLRQQPLPDLPAEDASWSGQRSTAAASPATAGAAAPDADLLDGTDPYDWDDGQDLSPSSEPEPGEASVGSIVLEGRRRTRSTTDDDVQIGAARPVRRSAGARLLRRALGMDAVPAAEKRANRSSKRATRGAKKAASKRSDQWLPGVDPAPTSQGREAVGVAAAGGGSSPVRRRGRRAGAQPAAAGTDFEVSGAPRGFTAVIWRWLARILVVLLLVAGVNQLFIRPFRGAPVVDVAPVASVDVGAAGQLAARFTADYLSYISTDPTMGAGALAANLPPTANASALLPNGPGYLRADVVQAGQVAVVDDVHVAVSVTARVRLAAAPAQGAPASTATAAVPAAAVDPGQVPVGWTDLGSRWVALVVPVEVTPAGLRVSPAGPVFSADPAGLVNEPAGGQEAPAAMVEATTDVAEAFFAGYASSQVSYLAAPGVEMGGLAGTVSLASVDSWKLTVPRTAASPDAPVDPTAGVGSGSVTWRVAGTGVSMRQQYTVAMTRGEGRWYAAALSPTARSAAP